MRFINGQKLKIKADGQTLRGRVLNVPDKPDFNLLVKDKLGVEYYRFSYRELESPD